MSMLLNEFYLISHDDEGNEYLVDNSFGGFLTHKQVDRLITLLTDYKNKYTDKDIVEMRNINEEHRRAIHEKLLGEDAPLKIDPGYVYILQSEHGYKIGHTKRLSNRMSHFGLKLPFKVKLWGVIPHDSPKALEKEFHEEFQYMLINGEWFDLGAEELQDIMDSDGFEKRDEELN